MNFFRWLFENALNITALGSVGLSLVTLLLAAKFATRAGVKRSHAAIYRKIELAESLRLALAERVTKIEAAMSQLANKDDINNVLIALERQNGDRRALGEKVDGLTAQIKALQRPVNLMEEFLLNRERT